jgi:hypothetical protein
MGRDAGIRLSFKKGWLAMRSSEGLKGEKREKAFE